MTEEPTKQYVNCQWCGKNEELHWYEAVNEYLIETGLCFDCGFWLGYILCADTDYTKDGQRIARINHQHYVICPDNPRPGLGSGYGGRKITLRFLDGTEVTTRNLWSQGEIPELFRDQLPDNAEWLSS